MDTIETNFHEYLFATTQERDSFMFNKNFLSDCTFVLRTGDKSIGIPCHKYILQCSSWYFYKYFETHRTNEVVVTGYCYEAVKKFLEFIYKGTTELFIETVMEVFKMAQTFYVKKLIKHVDKFLSENVTEKNLINFIEFSSEFDLEDQHLRKKCAMLIGRTQTDFFKSPQFLNMSRDCLIAILKFDYMSKTECDLYRCVLDWARKYCIEKQTAGIQLSRKRALGDALKYIRFPSMTVDEFCCINQSPLSNEQIDSIEECIGTDGNVKCEFSSVKRIPTVERVRFVGVALRHLYVNVNDLFKFSVSNTKTLVGFGFYKNTNHIKKRTTHMLIQLSRHAHGGRSIIYQSSVELTNVGGKCKAHDIFLREAVQLESNRLYSLCIRSSNYSRNSTNFQIKEPQISYTDVNGDKVRIHGSCLNFASLIFQ